jgi:hypothetical protein
MNTASAREYAMHRVGMRSFILAAFLVTGCVAPTVTGTQINTPPHALVQRAPADVPILTSGAPARPHVDVYALEVWEGGTPAMLTALRERAAAFGCDAVVVTSPESNTGGNGENVGTSHGFFATCIVYTDPVR